MLRLDEEFELDIMFNDAFKVRDAVGHSLDKFGSRAFFLFVFLLELFGGFSGKEGCRKWRIKEEKIGFSQINSGVMRKRMRHCNW